MDMPWRTVARRVVRLDHAQHAARVATVDANEHQFAKNVYRLAAVVSDLDWVDRVAGHVLPLFARWQAANVSSRDAVHG